MTKIDIISGFLGAGKTTLIKKLLSEALIGTRVVLIENEFGEIGIDGGFLRESGIEIREMNSGCICCSLVGDFGTSLREVMEKYAPERIIIEPSGVGKLSDVMRAVQDATEGGEMTLNSAVTVVDCTKARVYLKNFGEFFSNQIESAGTVLLTRTDKAGDDKIEEAAELVRKHNPKATIITTPLQELSGREILDTFEGNHDLEAELMAEVLAKKTEEHHHHHHSHASTAGEPDEEGVIVHHVFREEEHEHEGHEHHHEHEHEHEEHEHHHEHEHEHEEHGHHHEHEHEHEEHEHHHEHEHEHEHEHHHHHDHDADEIFSSWGMETPVKYTAGEIRMMLDRLEEEALFGTILRAKGMVPSENGWIEFDYVPGETEVRDGSPDVTGKICVIGAELNEENLEKLFRRRL